MQIKLMLSHLPKSGMVQGWFSDTCFRFEPSQACWISKPSTWNCSVRKTFQNMSKVKCHKRIEMLHMQCCGPLPIPYTPHTYSILKSCINNPHKLKRVADWTYFLFWAVVFSFLRESSSTLHLMYLSSAIHVASFMCAMCGQWKRFNIDRVSKVQMSCVSLTTDKWYDMIWYDSIWLRYNIRYRWTLANKGRQLNDLKCNNAQ